MKDASQLDAAYDFSHDTPGFRVICPSDTQEVRLICDALDPVDISRTAGFVKVGRPLYRQKKARRQVIVRRRTIVLLFSLSWWLFLGWPSFWRWR